jgi:hypothetical protein
MAFGNGAIDTGLIVGTITCEGREWTWDLVEQAPDLRAIVDIMGRKL